MKAARALIQGGWKEIKMKWTLEEAGIDSGKRNTQNLTVMRLVKRVWLATLLIFSPA